MNGALRMTVGFGLAAAVGSLSLSLLPQDWWWPAYRLYPSLVLDLYLLLLCRLRRCPPGQAIIPLVLALGAAWWPGSRLGFGLIFLAVLAWLRSGLAQPARWHPWYPLLVEILLAAGCILVPLFRPWTGGLTLALSIWLFFLIQSLYFVLVPENLKRPAVAAEAGFDEARRELERLLDMRWRQQRGPIENKH